MSMFNEVAVELVVLAARLNGYAEGICEGNDGMPTDQSLACRGISLQLETMASELRKMTDV